jgi:hypothetical protein
LRKKWLVLTPEEWVRQHAVQYLIQQKGYSSGLIHLEKGLKVNGLSKRADIVCYNRKMEPQLLVECKAPEIKLSQATFDQAARYNMTLRVPLLMITNGIEIYCAAIDFENSSYRFLEEVPAGTDKGE